MRSTQAFQAFKDVKKTVFDKTGTIIRGEPAVVEVVSLAGQIRVLRLAAAAESPSEHPLARGVVTAGVAQELPLQPATGFQAVPGKGLRATVDGQRVMAGNPRFVESEGIDLGPAREQIEGLQETGNTVVALAIEGSFAGLIAIADQIKGDARDAVERMRAAGLEPVMLTGDNVRTARAEAQQVGITEYRAEVLPQDKAAAVRGLQHLGYRVAMVGDGINDAPALVQADLGIAIGTGTDVAIESGDFTLISGDVQGVLAAIELSRATMRNIKENLFFAFVYNTLGIPIAAGILYPFFGVLLSPIIAAAAMALSSVSVVTNALRLAGFRARRIPAEHSEVVAVSRGEPAELPAGELPKGPVPEERGGWRPKPALVEDPVCHRIADPLDMAAEVHYNVSRAVHHQDAGRSARVDGSGLNTASHPMAQVLLFDTEGSRFASRMMDHRVGGERRAERPLSLRRQAEKTMQGFRQELIQLKSIVEVGGNNNARKRHRHHYRGDCTGHTDSRSAGWRYDGLGYDGAMDGLGRIRLRLVGNPDGHHDAALLGIDHRWRRVAVHLASAPGTPGGTRYWRGALAGPRDPARAVREGRDHPGGVRADAARHRGNVEG